MEKVRLGIIGMGNMGSGHAKNLMAERYLRLRLLLWQTARKAAASGAKRIFQRT